MLRSRCSSLISGGRGQRSAGTWLLPPTLGESTWCPSLKPLRLLPVHLSQRQHVGLTQGGQEDRRTV